MLGVRRFPGGFVDLVLWEVELGLLYFFLKWSYAVLWEV